MVFCQLRYISKGKSRECRHQKHILDYFKAFTPGITVIYTVNFFQSEKLRFCRLFAEFYPSKRIFLNPVVGKTTVGYLFQSLHVADERVLAEVFLCFEIHFVGADYFACEIRQREVVNTILVFDEFTEVTLHRFIPSPRYLHKVLADKLLCLVVMLLYDLQDCALLFTHLSDAIESLLNNQRIDFSSGLLEFCNNLVDTDARIRDEAVKVNSCRTRAFGAFFRLVPQVWEDTFADIILHTLTVNGDSHSD